MTPSAAPGGSIERAGAGLEKEALGSSFNEEDSDKVLRDGAVQECSTGRGRGLGPKVINTRLWAKLRLNVLNLVFGLCSLFSTQ